ncbi:MAG: Na/Pi cotransporter family protein [Planctomycetota bacterium]|jgi:phosphate:Na+ symporter
MAHDIINLLGGLALFLFGMEFGGKNLQRVFGKGLRRIISKVAGNRLAGVGVGTATTLITNSSSATSVLCVSLASARMMNLAEAVAIMLGASIGTALVAEIIAFRLTEWALGFIVLGFAINLAGKPVFLGIGRLIMGFGFIFYGMHLMSVAVEAYAQPGCFEETIGRIGTSPYLGVIAGLIFTAIIQSSDATVGILMGLSLGRNAADADFATCFPYFAGVVIGANVGTCVTALLASIRAETPGRQAAVAQLLFKLGGAVIVLPFLTLFAKFAVSASQAVYSESSPARMIANTHLFFNVGNTIIWLILLPVLVAVTRKIIPDRPEKELAAFRVKYLDPNLLKTPAAALDATRKEVERMSGYALDFVQNSIQLFDPAHSGRIPHVKEEDEKFDLLESEIVQYLAKLAQSVLTPAQSDEVMVLLNVADELENMCDVVVKNLGKKAEKMMLQKKLLFSTEGWDDIKEYHALVYGKILGAVDAFRQNEQELAKEVLAAEDGIIEHEIVLRRKHLERLACGYRETLETSQFHLDVLYNIRRLFQHAINICRIVLDEYKDPS